MKRKFPVFFIILLLLISINFAGLEIQGFAQNIGNKVNKLYELSLDERVEAENLLFRFFDAQVMGDTETIKKLLGGYLLKKREKLLNNPSYPDYLRRRFKNARFEIITFRKLQENTIQIDTKIILNEHESIHANFILVKEFLATNPSLSYRIHSQKVIDR